MGFILHCELVRETAENLHMKTNIIATNTVSLSNGFQCGQWVKFLTHPDGGKWEVATSKSTGECTWTDDESVVGMEVTLEGKGLVGGFHGVSAHTSQTTIAGFFGFTYEELAGPTPGKGYMCEMHGAHAEDWTPVETLADYLVARFGNNSFSPWSSKKDGVHKMPYAWGDQPADSYALVINHELVDSVTGCGDNTPHLTESEEKCLAERKLFTSSPRGDIEREQQECNERNNAALKLGWSEQWREVANHIRSSFRLGQNPLPTLRKKFCGKWTYYQAGNALENSVISEVRFTELLQSENELEECPEGYSGFWGNVWGRWQVSYVPAK
ncbi:MAG: hypothetical protein WCO79_03535 [bacterium]